MQGRYGSTLQVPKVTFGIQKQNLERKKSSSVANIDTSKQSVHDQISAFCGKHTRFDHHGTVSTEHSASSTTASSSTCSGGSGATGGSGFDSRRPSTCLGGKSTSCEQGLQKLSLIPVPKKHSFTIDLLDLENKPRSVSIGPHLKVHLQMSFEDPITGEMLTPHEYISIAVDDAIRLNSFPNEWSLNN
ncbi:uncharacterized protein LOC142335073 [Convolutriloba macropyga]|uniref:uncharacterized protein LOC142335073 n=1 Tax=Convolutriloba macropyga TaxID=536237 RepID=UPI003F522D9B